MLKVYYWLIAGINKNVKKPGAMLEFRQIIVANNISRHSRHDFRYTEVGSLLFFSEVCKFSGLAGSF